MPHFVRFLNRPVLAAALVAFAVLALPLVTEAQTATPKIAVVNLDYVVANSNKGKELQAKLAAFQQEIRQEIETKQEAARAIRQRIADGVNTLTEDKLSDLQKDFEDANIDIKRYQDDKQREGQKMQQEGLRAIEAELEPAFKAIRDEQGYDLILNNVPGTVVMASERIDITQMVIDRLAAGSGN